MTTYPGRILDFGGVVTTDFYGALAAFSVRSGLDAGAFVRVPRDDPEGREAFHAAECGQIPQRAAGGPSSQREPARVTPPCAGCVGHLRCADAGGAAGHGLKIRTYLPSEIIGCS